MRVDTTGYQRPIPRAHFEDAWRRLTEVRVLPRTEIQREISPFNPAYVAALLAQVPGVTHTLSPIALHLVGAPQTSPKPALAHPLPATSQSSDEAEEEEPVEVEEDLADRLAAYGRSCGFEVFKEWRTETGNRIDLVWATAIPSGLRSSSTRSVLPVVGFEIESSWRTRKHVKGDILNLQDLAASLGVIVLCKGRDEAIAEIESLRVATRRYVTRVGAQIDVWIEEDAERLLAQPVSFRSRP